MEWISVNDSLPKKMIKVLVYGRYARDCPRNVMEAVFDTRKKIFLTDFKVKDVTHWMPLPDPPKITQP